MTYAAFLFAFIAPFQLIPRDGSTTPISTLLAMVGLVVASAVLAYVLLRRSDLVTFERRGALIAAGLMALLSLAQSDVGDLTQRVASAAALASFFFLIVLWIGVSIHALAYGVAALRRRSAPA